LTYTIEPGASGPEGATWVAERNGTNFAVFARNATRVELCLFAKPRGLEVQRLDLPCRKRVARICAWHQGRAAVRLSGARSV
jgi:pullulanase/glycogen debranching enzyme